MNKNVSFVLMAALGLAAIIPTSSFAADTAKTSYQEAQKDDKSLKKGTSWQYKDLTISVYSDQTLTDQDKKKFEKITDSQVFTGSNSLTSTATTTPSQSPQYVVPGSDGGFTLFSNQNKTFDNSFTYNAIYGAVGYVFSTIAVPASFGAQLSTAAGVGGISNAVYNWLGLNTFVYTNLRLGTSYNSYWGYYEYIQSQTRYTYSNYTYPSTVEYYSTGTKVPDSTLSLYGLHN